MNFEKWVVMGALAIISIILGLLPYYIMRYTRTSLHTNSVAYKIVLTVLSCFGGGVLLSTTFVHVLPECREKIENVPEIRKTFDAHFPVAEMLLLCGFALIYLVEEVAHFIMVDGHHLHHHHHTNTIARHNSIAHGIPVPNGGNRSRSSMAISHIDDTSVRLSTTLKLQGTDVSLSESDEECPDDKTNITSSLRAIMALIALSFHAIMEGVAIGIQNSSDVWFMFGAVASHKFVISFCMGMELMSSNASIWTYIGSIVFFAVISPVGIVIGSVISSSSSSTDSLSVVIIEGLVCGTLLYVVFFEILNRERERKSYSMQSSRAIGFIQFISLVVGLVSMGCLSTLTHSHDENENTHNSTNPSDVHEHHHIYQF